MRARELDFSTSVDNMRLKLLLITDLAYFWALSAL